jgi:hypothetical protein
MLVLSGGNKGHEANEMAQRETWASRLPKSIQMYWLKGDYSAKGVKISKSEKTITVPLEESVNNVLEKTTVALSYCIENFDFDQVLRTNTSCYFSPTLIESQLSQLPQVGLYGGFQGVYNPSASWFSKRSDRKPFPFVSGAGIWLSKDVACHVSKIRAADYTHLIDDVAIGKHTQTIFPITNIPRQDVTDWEPIWPGAHTRVKHNEKGTVTVSRMHMLDEIYSSRNENEMRRAVHRFDKKELELINNTFGKEPITLEEKKTRITQSQDKRIQSFCDLVLGAR